MSIFDILTLFGGLAMFLYGMRLMGNGLKESSSGTLKVAMESVTNNMFKAFMLGMLVTAIIQSSTATIVITSGLVAAGIITLKQSLGIIVGANVGTTITGQIIRLLDIDSSSGAWLQLFKPSTLAPIALIIGIIMIMGMKFKHSKSVGNIMIGFGILFSGLMNMTNAVETLNETGIFESLFSSLGSNPVIGYLTGATVAFILQSSSATIGILQAFSQSGKLLFSSIYAVIVGVYLGDCVTTAIVCWIGAKAEARRVGIVNIVYNLCKSALVLSAVGILKSVGLLDGIWNSVANTGFIADTNTIFNLVCAVVLLPFMPAFEKLSLKIVKDDEVKEENKYADKLEALNPAFFSTPALALRSCYELLLAMFYASRDNIEKSLKLLRKYDEAVVEEIQEEEQNIDLMADRLASYLGSLSGNLQIDEHLLILNQYYKVVTEFERLSDYAVNICEVAQDLVKKDVHLSSLAIKELDLLDDILAKILDHTEQTFKKRDVEHAYEIEPLEEVVDDLTTEMKKNHMMRLQRGECSVYAGTDFMDILAYIERISDICSDVGAAVVARVNPDLGDLTHDYIQYLHSGNDQRFNLAYANARDLYFGKLEQISSDETEDQEIVLHTG